MLKAGCAMLSRPTGLGASCQADADGQKREETLPIDWFVQQSIKG